MEETYESLKERFLARVDRTENGCWKWLGRTYLGGYGYFTFFGKSVPAHRVSYLLFVDANLPHTYVVHHTCENKSCVRPSHLEAMFKRTHSRIHLAQRKGWYARYTRANVMD